MLELTYVNEVEKHEVEFSKLSDNVVQCLGDFDIKNKGFYLSRTGKNDMWDYSAYDTMYRRVKGGAQFSNNGSVWVEPKKNVDVLINWDDGNNTLNIRPDSVDVEVFVNGRKTADVTLAEENGWKYTFADVPASSVFSIKCSGIEDYDVQISGCVVYAHTDYPVPEEVSVDDLAEAITEVYEMVAQNSEEIVTTQLAVAEIYEMIAEDV